MTGEETKKEVTCNCKSGCLNKTNVEIGESGTVHAATNVPTALACPANTVGPNAKTGSFNAGVTPVSLL